jgi:lysophospholipase L1-like esterase
LNAGVLAFGDSITNGGGELQWGVALQSWALWTARGLGLPYTGYAVDGARVEGVLGEQLPAFTARTALPDARYAVGCLYAGVNDVRVPGFDAAAFERAYREVASFLAARCERVLLVTIPEDLGRPRAGGVDAGNAAILRVAAELGALVLDLRGFGARNLVMVDHVHPTAFGQVWIAERALRALDLPVRVWPSTLINPNHPSPLRALQGDWTYVYRDLKESLRAWAAARRAARPGAGRSGRTRR